MRTTNYIFEKMDKDHDNCLSFMDYRTSVYEDPIRLEIMGKLLPSRSGAEKFWRMFSTRPFVYCLDLVDSLRLDVLEKQKQSEINKRRLTLIKANIPINNSTQSSFTSNSTGESSEEDNVENDPIVPSLLGR